MKESPERHRIINLHDAASVDSAAVGLLVVTSRRLLADKRILSLVGPQGTVMTIFEMANLDGMISVFHTGEAAVQAQAA